MFWDNDLYKDNPSQWGQAVSVGHVSYYTTWETPETTIGIALTGNNFEIRLSVEYLSLELKKLEDKADEKQDADDF